MSENTLNNNSMVTPTDIVLETFPESVCSTYFLLAHQENTGEEPLPTVV